MSTDDTTTVYLYGGPLDGMQVPLTLDPADPDPGVAMMSDTGRYGEGGRSWYEPNPQSGRWEWVRDTP